MTTAEALEKMHSATRSNVMPDADMTSFGGWSVDDVIEFLRSATLADLSGEGAVFTVGDHVTVIFARGKMYCSGKHRP